MTHEHTATYSPDDNKLRLYPAHRLSAEEYNRVKAAGFKWAPKQGLFVAPTWTPGREDLLQEMCGEIGDEDTSLVDRAEQRAERFEEYSDKRAADADRAHAGVKAITDGIPLGQPILVGHHSEKRARKDAERIENGMRHAVKMWETSKYWEQRAAGALAHAKYKERPDVRARRIKTIEADARKIERSRAKQQKFLDTYRDPEAQEAKLGDGRPLIAALLDSWEGGLSYEDQRAYERGELAHADALARAVKHLTNGVQWCERWARHYANRLAYERAMLEEQGAADLLKPKPRPKQLPLCNYRAPEGLNIPNPWNRGEPIHYPQMEMTRADYARINTDYRGTRVLDGTHRVRTASVRGHKLVCVFLTDYKETPPPAAPSAEELEAKASKATAAALAKAQARAAEYEERKTREAIEDKQAAPFDAMREQLRTGGVQVVTAPQLFPTPPDLAERMATLADIQPGHSVLEPSGGTGRIIIAVKKAQPAADITAVEIKEHLAGVLRSAYRVPTHCRDFLQCNGELGTFDRILMNPPFKDAQDIAHIKHALHMLKPGGRLVAICANGPRQQRELGALVEEMGGTWEPLPAGTFKESGTGVNAALLVLDAPKESIAA